MDWKRGRRSSNIEDRRGQRVAGSSGGGMLPYLLMGVGRRFGLVGVLVVLAGLWLFNGGLQQVLGGGASGGAAVEDGGAPTSPSDEVADFVSVVLASTEDEWTQIFREHGQVYRAPRLVLFDDRVQSACGLQSSATGPFYCPGDQKVYLDLGFFRELARLGGPGDFAAAYVVGHEVGHHVQNLLGISDRVHDARSRLGRAEGNALSVALELQADCFAGVWANRTDRRGIVTLSAGDVNEGLEAARSIGDDRLQRQAGRAVSPESFTHGSSEQRARWLRAGLAGGDVDRCDTFEGAD